MFAEAWSCGDWAGFSLAIMFAGAVIVEVVKRKMGANPKEDTGLLGAWLKRR